MRCAASTVSRPTRDSTTTLLLFGIISEQQAWAGFSSPSIITIGVLFVFARALEETRTVDVLLRRVLGRPRSHGAALVRLTLPTACFSAFMNNTPIVAMLTSVVEAWAARCVTTPAALEPTRPGRVGTGACRDRERTEPHTTRTAGVPTQLLPCRCRPIHCRPTAAPLPPH